MSNPYLTDKQKNELKNLLKGDVCFDKTTRLLYSTDASAYRENPMAVVFPRDEKDVELLVGYAADKKLPLIPRGAGTSLAGQVVGSGIVVDVSRYLNSIIVVNEAERWAIVQPGVVLDELNIHLKTLKLFFAPETSTSNRCNIGGMVGNNSCGTHSMVYGSTRDHLLEVTGYLSSGEKVVFRDVSLREFQKKCESDSFEGTIYKRLFEILGDKKNQQQIIKEYPHREIKRRNTGYALDLLLHSEPFESEEGHFNMCRLIAGSEGTLMFITQIKLNLVSVPPSFKALVCVHFNQLKDAVVANMTAIKHSPVAVELMDKLVLDLTKENTQQNKNRFFIEGDPAALLLIEFAEATKELLDEKVSKLVTDFEKLNYGYALPILYGADINRVWSLRKAGLGVLSNMPGDQLPVPVIEDTAIRPEDLPSYVEDIEAMLKRLGKECVYYAHIGTGELHLRPVLNMKQPDDVKLFRQIAEETSVIVKKYNGSLSGEHGDGRLRGEFIPQMLGIHNYELLREVKNIFDPNGIFNPGKIVDTPPMDTFLRYSSTVVNSIEPMFRWDKTGGIVQGADKCTGSADCRKSDVIGGAMCPSYKATRNEKDSTRARANILREFFTGGIDVASNELEIVKEVLDLCLSCKACKNECPSSIDMTKLKAEFLNYYHSIKGVSLRDRFMAMQPFIYQLASKYPSVYNGLIRQKWIKELISKFLKLHPNVSFPMVAKETLKDWYDKRFSKSIESLNGRVVVLADEFSNFSDDGIGQKCVLLLSRLGYDVEVSDNCVTGRTYLSKGLLHKAQKLADDNVKGLVHIASKGISLVGIEPSAILCFRDEYPELVSEQLKPDAEKLANHSFTIEEFLHAEMVKKNIDKKQFSGEKKTIHFHAHCYQKALSSTDIIKKVLEFPVHFSAIEIQSGCCGMAGSFGYEAEHATLSKQIGEQRLFPAVRQCAGDEVVAASGMSCRHHITENTGSQVLHPGEILYHALI